KTGPPAGGPPPPGTGRGTTLQVWTCAGSNRTTLDPTLTSPRLAELNQLPQPVAQGGLGHRRVTQSRQLGQGELRVGLPEGGGLPQLGGEGVQGARLPEGLD